MFSLFKHSAYGETVNPVVISAQRVVANTSVDAGCGAGTRGSGYAHMLGGFNCISDNRQLPGFPQMCANVTSNAPGSGLRFESYRPHADRSACLSTGGFLLNYDDSERHLTWSCRYPKGAVNCRRITYDQTRAD